MAASELSRHVHLRVQAKRDNDPIETTPCQEANSCLVMHPDAALVRKVGICYELTSAWVGVFAVHTCTVGSEDITTK